MKNIFSYRLLSLAALVFCVCFARENGVCAQTIRYAQGFTIDDYNGFKVLTVLNPWNGANRTYQYLLASRGVSVPAAYSTIPRIDVPVRSVVTMSTTHLAYLEKLKQLDTLIGYNTLKHVNSPAARRRIQAGEIQEVGGGPTINVERIMELAPELVMMYSLGNPDDAYFKLREARLNVVLNAEYMEPTPLGRAEWIKFVAAFFNRDAAAQQIFDEIALSYERMAARAAEVKDKPTVFLNAPYKGEWWMPGGKSYLAIFLRDAGADYLWNGIDSQGSNVLDMEAVYERAADADYWLHPGDWRNLREGLARDERLGEFRAFQEGRIYNNNARVNAQGGNDYWESGLTRPDLVLADLLKIFHPALLPEHELRYYQQLK